MPNVTFHTLGCKLNLAETSGMIRAFEDRDFAVVPFGAYADVAVVNTCSVTSEADRKCRQAIRRARRANPNACVIVTGCYAQLRPESIARIEGVDYVLGTREKARLFDIVKEFGRKEQTQVAVSCIGEAQSFDPALLSDDRTRAFLKVQDGCDYSCSFCTIPLARGGSRSASVAQVIRQARDIASQETREIVLTGVNVGLFGKGLHDTDRSASLLQLLEALEAVDGIERYRISSIEPNLLTDAMIDFVAASPVFVPHFHVPLQSGDDAVLGAMRRRYRRSRYADRVARILEKMPEAAIGADVIVGFPAETDVRFENTYRFLDGLPLAYLHVFSYSERPNTAAVDKLDLDPVPRGVRRARSARLRKLSNLKSTAFRSRFVGTVRPVLWERSRKRDHMSGLTDNYIRMRRPYDAARAGTIEYVRLGAAESALAHCEA